MNIDFYDSVRAIPVPAVALRLRASRFHALMHSVRIGIATGKSDRTIAEENNTLVEFVRRERKFLQPSPPISSEQHKRGIFRYRHSPETRAKISKALQGRKLSPETRAKISKALQGRKLSPEARAKMSEAKQGRKLSPETRAKISKAKRGRKHSPETRAKISKAKRGSRSNFFYQTAKDDIPSGIRRGDHVLFDDGKIVGFTRKLS